MHKAIVEVDKAENAEPEFEPTLIAILEAASDIFAAENLPPSHSFRE